MTAAGQNLKRLLRHQGTRPTARPLAVDALRAQQEIVVKSLGRYIGQIEGITGASILADGQVALILDVASLARAAMQGNSVRRNRVGRSRRDAERSTSSHQT